MELHFPWISMDLPKFESVSATNINFSTTHITVYSPPSSAFSLRGWVATGMKTRGMVDPRVGENRSLATGVFVAKTFRRLPCLPSLDPADRA